MARRAAVVPAAVVPAAVVPAAVVPAAVVAVAVVPAAVVPAAPVTELPWRWPLLGAFVVVMTALQVARLVVPAQTPPSLNQVGMFMTPFRQVTEVVDGGARTTLGCVDDSGQFKMTGLTSSIIGAWSGSHHRKIALYNVLSDAIVIGDPGVRRVLRAALCDDREVRRSLGCSGRGDVVVVTRALDGGRRVVEARCE